MPDFSTERKAAFYGGNALTLIGLLLFLSFFVTVARGFGGTFPGPGAIFAPMVGFIMMILGRFIRLVGARGLAGSGMLLDPEKAREDLQPYTRMAGGMLNDALEVAEIGRHVTSERNRVVMLKCGECEFLNEENSKFCQECGAKM